jgi:hypothetical protein
MTTLVPKCVVTELSEHVFTECTPTRRDCQNEMRDIGYLCYTVIIARMKCETLVTFVTQ